MNFDLVLSKPTFLTHGNERKNLFLAMFEMSKIKHAFCTVFVAKTSKS